jgi:hypothetical protein
VSDWTIAVRGTKKLLTAKRLWLGPEEPDRLGWVIEVMEWVSDQEVRR